MNKFNFKMKIRKMTTFWRTCIQTVPSRFNLRIKIRGIVMFFMISKSQTIEGVTSLTEYNKKNPYESKHAVLWDLEECTLSQAEETLLHVQNVFGLGDIYIVSDKKYSYRAWCFTRVNLREYLKILVETDYVDMQFINYTVRRNRATLRLSRKKDREPQKIISVLKSNFRDGGIPSKMEYIKYDTGLMKSGLTINIGEK